MQDSVNERELLDITPFTPDKPRSHLGVYIVQDLSPSPEMSIQFHTQSEYDINGNDFVSRCICLQEIRRHKHVCHSTPTINTFIN